MMKLYGYNTINTLKVLLILLETETTYEFHPVDIRQGEQHLPAFRTVNPVGKVPVLADGDLVLTESNAILLYIARKTSWGIQDTAGTYEKVVSWLFYQASTQGPYFGQIEYWSVLAKKPNGEAAVHFRSIAQRSVTLLETALQDSKFLCGTDYGIADLAHFVWMRHCSSLGVSLENAPCINKWVETISARPATKQALAFFASDMFSSAPLKPDT
ncbi:MAG: glutathione S-transferase family protein [Roseobacter sp.]